ncbi:ABC transporter permease YtrF precursor [Pseudobythopirellula maris]|uniref:ABC transporter permease YtrF n=1 Tax=Pseudobythopirellula maris TaxID=2527991 RepID=A0A5C5ZUM3_9BACT|nr:ABC transporter permease [Pseudobythopirellula maris]TWT90815.1 ABC transporter permease YtrF precursor [Pseudobythopirellula maris]
MSFWKIAWRNMQQRGLASSLTALSMALGVAAMVGVIVIHSVTVRQFQQSAHGYNLIVGGKGGALQLVLSTVYHLGQPLYPISYDYYRKFVDGEFASVTDVAIPYCLGDSFDPSNGEDERGLMYRVVATTPDLFNKLNYGIERDGTFKRYEFSEGRNFLVQNAYEAVVGSVVAAQADLHEGDTIQPTHGVSGDGEVHIGFKVVGVLEPTGTANDRAVFVNLEGFFQIDDHALGEPAEGVASEPLPETSRIDEPRGALPPAKLFDNQGAEIEPLPMSQREVTSILVATSNAFGSMALSSRINKDGDTVAQAVAPIGVIESLLNAIVKPVQIVLLVMTVLIVVVASISILVSIYNSMSERSHDIAVMRALGASRSAVMLVVLSESVLLSLTGGLLGIVLGHAMVGLAAPYVEAQTGVRLNALAFDPWEAAVIPALVALAALVGLLPAISAYRTDVAKALQGAR